MTKFIIKYRNYDQYLGRLTNLSGYFDSKEDADEYLKLHGYEWSSVNNQYSHKIHRDFPRIIELHKQPMDLTLPEVDTSAYEELGVKVEVKYIGTLAEVTTSEIEVNGIKVNSAKFIDSYSLSEYLKMDSAIEITQEIINKVNPNLGEFGVELHFEEYEFGDYDFRWRVAFTDSNDDVITWLDTEYYGKDSVNIFVNEIEDHLRKQLQ